MVRSSEIVGNSDSKIFDRGTERNNIIIQSNAWDWLVSGAGDRQKLNFGIVEMETMMKNLI